VPSHTPEDKDQSDILELKQKITDAASTIYEAKGRQASVEEIAKAAGISVPVTYQYLKKPSDIMLLIMENLHHQFAAAFGQALEDSDLDPKEKLRTAIRLYFRVVDKQRSKVVLVYRSSLDLNQEGRKFIMERECAVVEVFRRILDEGVARDIFRVMDTDLMAFNINMLGHMWALKSWHFKRQGAKLDEYMGQQMDLIMNMVKP
jgi:TetR/AcrR family transcriptional regulator, cholesterol catabolism regulator